MSLREKQLWISLAVGVVVWGAYGWRLWSLVEAGGATMARDAGLAFLLALGVTVVAEAGLSAVPAWLQRRARPAQDEALTQAALIAGHVALMVLIGLVALVTVGLWIAAVWLDRPGMLWVAPLGHRYFLVILANVLVGCVVLAEGARTVLTLILVRRR